TNNKKFYDPVWFGVAVKELIIAAPLTISFFSLKEPREEKQKQNNIYVLRT
ncbi:1108_t:CDS:1, partial [Funneliformis mosseae]